MRLNLSISGSYLAYSLIVMIAVFDIVFPEGSSTRFVAIAAQGLLLCLSLVYLLASYSTGLERTAMHGAMLAFVLLIVFYGIVTPNISIVPVILYPLLAFYLIYYLASKGCITSKGLRLLGLFLLLIYSYETYLSIFDREERLGEFFRKADNVGYKSLFVMLILSLELKSFRDISLFTAAFVLVLLSFKRGAMIIAAMGYLIALAPIFLGTARQSLKSIDRLKLMAISFVVSAVMLYYVMMYWDVLMYRFVNDPGGSGRESFYMYIFNAWINSDLLNLLFGHGLFAVEGLIGIYAHNDWLELLYDHGVVGILLYLVLIVAYISHYKLVKRYAPHLYSAFCMAACFWLVKSFPSGVYINKGSVIIFVVIGYVLAVAKREKRQLINEKTRREAGR